MNHGLFTRVSLRHRYWTLLLLFLSVVPLSKSSFCQTSSTGAMTGVTLDPSGAALPQVSVQLTKPDGTEARKAESDENGRFGFSLLPPGTYAVRLSKVDFGPVTQENIHIHVTETLRIRFHLALATRMERTQVTAESAMVQVDTAALGRIANQETVTSLPLATRNFVQMAGLSPGVVLGVNNSGELGTGATALSQLGKSNDGMFAHGARSYDNNWQLDGISVSDVQGSGSISGGVPIPNPDTLEEFKVQTGLYDAAFGRGAGANVSVVTKTGTDQYHGTIFEFFRNDFLNANDFFLNRTGQQRPALKQNQAGLALGGPIKRDMLLFFGSYQRTRQLNGLAAGQARIACSVSLIEPPITNDRSQKALGQLFGGMTGALGGGAIASDGSNINPVALALLNFKLPDGSFLIPTPETVDPAKSFASSGFSTFTQPCTFNEDQGLANVSYFASQKSRLGVRFFIAHSDQLVSFPGSGLNPIGNTRGFSSPSGSEFVVLSLTHSYVLNSASLNEARGGFVRTRTESGAEAPFKWSDIGVAEGEMNKNNELPNLSIVGSVSMATVTPRTYAQDSFVFSDVLSFARGANALKLGGSLTRLEDNLDFAGLGSFVQFLSWPDFLLGLDAASNGTATFSNVSQSADIFGLLNREFRVWEGSAFIQDDYRIRRTVTLNLGLRYERLGQFGDNMGRNSSFDINKADANPPPTGSFDGYLVASNFPGVPPPGVIRANNTFATYGEGQNTIAPRTGFAWQILPETTRLALRGGYGLYYSRPTGQASTESVLAAPFSMTRFSSGLSNAAATFKKPFAQPFPTSDSFPLFTPYSSTTKNTVNALAPDFRPAMVQQFSLDVEAEPYNDWLLEAGYVGSRALHLQRYRSLNQALDASPENPIDGVTSNTLANIGSRVPIPGIRADSLREIESEGSSWYHGLEMSLTKRLGHGLQFLASYTFSKTLDTDGADINSTSSGNALTLGDQNSPRQRWGRASFDRTHRFVLSTTWMLPGPPRGLARAVLGDWSMAAIVTKQSGSALTIADTNSTNAFGISEDRAQLTGTCSNNQFVKGGPVKSNLNGYFNTTCFTNPSIIGADGIGTSFGNSATGIVDGPGQANIDLSFWKTIVLRWPAEKSSLEVRAEFYNALNHTQFANPDSSFTSPSFGVVTSTAVNARVGQLAMKFVF
jgi:Carboxypeptidase regulatory-like domain